MEGTSRPSRDRGSTTSGYNSAREARHLAPTGWAGLVATPHPIGVPVPPWRRNRNRPRMRPEATGDVRRRGATSGRLVASLSAGKAHEPRASTLRGPLTTVQPPRPISRLGSTTDGEVPRRLSWIHGPSMTMSRFEHGTPGTASKNPGGWPLDGLSPHRTRPLVTVWSQFRDGAAGEAVGNRLGQRAGPREVAIDDRRAPRSRHRSPSPAHEDGPGEEPHRSPARTGRVRERPAPQGPWHDRSDVARDVRSVGRACQAQPEPQYGT